MAAVGGAVARGAAVAGAVAEAAAEAGAIPTATAAVGFTFSFWGLIELIKWLIASAFSVLFVCGPISAYAPQYHDISKGQGEAFSTLVSLVMLTANILRLFFWIGKRFEMVLVYQSIIMIGVQLAMMEVCVRVRSAKLKHKRSITDWDWNHFWSWTDFSSYVIFLLGFTVFFGVTSLIWIDADWYIEGLGFLALSIESTIGFPQVYNNWKKGPAGLSVWLIGNWLVGDITKTLFYMYLAAPFQFTFSGTVQTVTDVYIIYQIWRYRSDTASSGARPSSEGSSGVVIDHEHEHDSSDASPSSTGGSTTPLSSISS